jgi:hypothetical protein
MNISLSFSGGISHEGDVPAEKQKEIADAVAATVKTVVEANAGSGSGSVTVGQASATIVASSTNSL